MITEPKKKLLSAIAKEVKITLCMMLRNDCLLWFGLRTCLAGSYVHYKCKLAVLITVIV